MRAMLCAVVVAATTTIARAEAPGASEPARYAIGLDLVSTTLFRGIGLETGMRAGRWRARIGYAHQKIPSAFVDMDARDKGWAVTTDVFVGAADYWFGTRHDGAYATLELAVNRAVASAPMSAGSTTAWDPAISPGIGYHWSPFGNAFYVEPRCFLIVNTPIIAGSERVGDTSFQHPLVIPAGWIVVGAQL
jgi:hypothetical protein